MYAAIVTSPLTQMYICAFGKLVLDYPRVDNIIAIT